MKIKIGDNVRIEEEQKVYRLIFDGQCEPAYFPVNDKGLEAMNRYYFSQVPLFSHPIVEEITYPVFSLEKQT